MVSRHTMSTGTLRYQVITRYISITSAIPDTIAENRNTIGIIGVDHHGFAFTDPKMNPTYPWRRNADGMPTIVTKRPTRSSTRSASSLILLDPSANSPYAARTIPDDRCHAMTISFRYSSQISTTSTAIKYQR